MSDDGDHTGTDVWPDTPTDTRMPSLGLLRQLTDRHVLDALLGTDALIRAEMSVRTGISKPTISESVRRLSTAGLLEEAGRQTGGRGRAGVYYRLRDDLGVALAIAIGPTGTVVDTLDVRGRVVGRRTASDSPAGGSDEDMGSASGAEIVVAVRRAADAADGPVVASAVSLAGPVDQRTGRVVELPDAPFPIGALDAGALIGAAVGASVGASAGHPVVVDNDVNWAALAEHRDGAARDLDHFFACYLGPGLGGSVVIDGEVVHGSVGLAGEIAHVRTIGPGGHSLPLIGCFAAAGLLRTGSSAIDLDRLGDVLTGTSGSDRAITRAVVDAVAGMLVSVASLLNPQAIVIGGPWSAIGSFADRVAEVVRADPAVDTEVRAAALGDDAPLVGVRTEAVRLARVALLGRVAEPRGERDGPRP